MSGRAYGGLIANAYSLTQFICELFKQHSVLLSDEWKQILLTKQKVLGGKEIEMTLDCFSGKLDYFAHAGAGVGYYCEMRVYPSRNLVTAILFNRSGIRDERSLDKPDLYVLSILH